MKILLKKIKEVIRPFMPQWVINLKRYMVKQVKHYWEWYKIYQFQSRYPKILKKLKDKERIKVAFFLINCSVWKCDKLFRLMLENEKFDPIIVICPYIVYGDETMIRDMKQAEEFVRFKKYPYVVTLNFETGEWLDVKEEIRPDIVFFTNPHYKLTKDEYYITNYTESLNCYIPYAFMAVNTYELQFNQLFHNIVWTLFYETPIHKKMAQKYSHIKGKNVYVSGYPGCDIFLDRNYQPQQYPWKNKALKKLIWAPHWLMTEVTMQATFFEYYQIMLDIAKKYEDKLQIAFKPHPLLKPKLYTYDDWGEERTNTYFEIWNNLANGQLEEGDYVDLFHTSDALLHDGGSFISEYLSLGKPAMYMVRNDNIMKIWNEYGEKAINTHYLGFNYKQVEEFIENVVINGVDPKKDERERFIIEYLRYNDHGDASECIFEYLKSNLK